MDERVNEWVKSEFLNVSYKDLKSAYLSGLLFFHLVYKHLPTDYFEFISDPQKHHALLARKNLYMFFSGLKHFSQLLFS